MSDTERGHTAEAGRTPERPAGTDGFDAQVPSAATTVLIAVEDSESVSVVRTAYRLFGENAHYFVINVGSGPYTSMAWASVSLVMSPATWYPPLWTDEQAAEMIDSATDRAEQQATETAAAASIGEATILGEVGDPATAILTAAHQHEVDVVVIGSHDRPWFSKLLSRSVGEEVLSDADLPVLVVK